MRKHNGMRPQDIVILLQMILFNNRKWTFSDTLRVASQRLIPRRL